VTMINQDEDGKGPVGEANGGNATGSRRSFLKTAAAATAGLALPVPLSGCTSGAEGSTRAGDTPGSASTEGFGSATSGQQTGGEIKLGVASYSLRELSRPEENSWPRPA